MDKVAKSLVFVEDGGEKLVLLSLKKKPHKKSDRKLELLGGHLDAGESSLEALIRELIEEETSGVLAKKMTTAQPEPVEIVDAGAQHFLFELCISKAEYGELIASSEESYGFQLVSLSDLFTDVVQKKLTRRTRAILAGLKKVGVIGA